MLLKGSPSPSLAGEGEEGSATRDGQKVYMGILSSGMRRGLEGVIVVGKGGRFHPFTYGWMVGINGWRKENDEGTQGERARGCPRRPRPLVCAR